MSQQSVGLQRLSFAGGRTEVLRILISMQHAYSSMSLLLLWVQAGLAISVA